MAFFNYFFSNNEEPQNVAEPPAYTAEPEEEVKCGSKPCGEKPPCRQPCNKPCCQPKPPCNPCDQKPSCNPCDQKPPCPPKPPCNPCEQKPSCNPCHQKPPCPPKPPCNPCDQKPPCPPKPPCNPCEQKPSCNPCDQKPPCPPKPPCRQPCDKPCCQPNRPCEPKSCSPNPCKPCNPCEIKPPCPPKPPCEPQPQPPKPCCTPCPPRPPKPCPKPCPKPLPCRKPCNPCDNQVGWVQEPQPSTPGSSAFGSSPTLTGTDPSSDSEFPPQPFCIYNACKLVIWVSLNLLFTAASLVYALSLPTVNVFNVIFIFVNLIINFLGLAGLYNNCSDYIQLAAWWQWIAVPLSLFFAFQVFMLGVGALILYLLNLDPATFPIASAIGVFLNSLPTAIQNLVFIVAFLAYAIGLVFFAFEWAQAACARCVTVDCDNDCGWFTTIVDLIGSLIPVSSSVITLVFNTLASIFATPDVGLKSAGYGSHEAAQEKAYQGV